MTKIARSPTYSREATRETSFHGLAAPHFSGAFELFGQASSMPQAPSWRARQVFPPAFVIATWPAVVWNRMTEALCTPEGPETVAETTDGVGRSRQGRWR